MDAETARALLAAPELLEAAATYDLRTAERLRTTWPSSLVAAATQQAELRHRAAAKFSDPTGLLLTRPGLEQATAEPVARHRAMRFGDVDGTVTDLCCGIGADLLALRDALPATSLLVGVDRDETHAVCARHNARVHVAVADVRELRYAGVAAAYVDPARRSGDRRGGSSPPVEWCMALPVSRLAVKAAPGIDPQLAPDGWEVEFVALGRQLKEATLWSPQWATAPRRATVLPEGATMVAATVEAPPVRPPGRYVLDPSPAVTRAGAVADLALLLDAWQLDRRIAFLSADHPLHSPFGRPLVVLASLPFGLKALAAELRRLGAGPVEFRRRGLAGDVDELRRRLRTTGDRPVTVLLTRVAGKPWAIVCADAAAA